MLNIRLSNLNRSRK